MNDADLTSPLEEWVRNIRDVYRLHKKELDSIEDKDLRTRRLVELNAQEQALNVYKTAVVQRRRVYTHLRWDPLPCLGASQGFRAWGLGWGPLPCLGLSHCAEIFQEWVFPWCVCCSLVMFLGRARGGAVFRLEEAGGKVGATEPRSHGWLGLARAG
jgi:hypothetical protein